MPLIDDVIKKLQGNSLFTTLAGQFEFLYVPFGISNSPVVFSRYIYAILLDMVQDGTVVTYMDDLIVSFKNVNEAIRKLERVRNRILELKIKWRKC